MPLPPYRSCFLKTHIGFTLLSVHDLEMGAKAVVAFVIFVKPRLHDTAGCQTGCTTGLTTGCIV